MSCGKFGFVVILVILVVVGLVCIFFFIFVIWEFVFYIDELNDRGRYRVLRILLKVLDLVMIEVGLFLDFLGS